MGVHDMRCPKCGKQSTEYDEDKWQCLHCGNKFIYREESDTYNTSVNVQGSTLFDIDTADPSFEIPLREPYVKWHSLENDPQLQAARNHSVLPRSFKDDEGRFTVAGGCATIFLFICLINIVGAIAKTANTEGNSPIGGIIALIAIGAFLVHLAAKKRRNQKIAERESYLSSLEETVGWITICPFCTEAHSRHYDGDHSNSEPETGPTHCTSCGKQFMLVKGKAFKIKK